jgi:hypothetical protein
MRLRAGRTCGGCAGRGVPLPRAWLRGTFRDVSRKHLPRYLDEFAYRFSHRDRDDELACLILERGFAAAPLTYPRLVERGA